MTGFGKRKKGKMGIREKIRKNFFQGMRKALKPLWFQGSLVAAGEGFEPSHTESESAVLPLHKPAVSVHLSEQILLYRKVIFCQEGFSIFQEKF